MKYGLILEGGGMRGAFTAGVLDVFAEEGISFDYACGVSAGAGTLCNYISGQEGRSIEAMLCPRGSSYYGIREFLRSGKFLNLDKLYGKIIYEDPAFDFEAYFKNPTEVETVATNCETGKAEYLKDDKSIESFCSVAKATCSLPIISRPCEMNGKYYMDGSVSDPIPFERAFEKGCDRIIFLSTKGQKMDPSNLKKYAWFMKIIYPSKFRPFIEAVKVRIPLLTEQYRKVDELCKEGKIMMLHPSGDLVIGHMEKDREKIQALYDEGRAKALEMMPEIKEFMSK